MAGGVGHDDQRVGRIVGAIVENDRAELHRPFDLAALLVEGPHKEVEMDLLWGRTARPCRPRQRLDLLDGELRRSGSIIDDDEVRVVVGPLARPVRQTEELLPERSEGAAILGIKAWRDELGRRVAHAVIESINGATSSPSMRR